MERTLEFEGRDLAEALKAASAQLGIAEEEIDFRLIDEGRKGVFGLGARLVRIRVSAPDPVDVSTPVAEPVPPVPSRSRPSSPAKPARRPQVAKVPRPDRAPRNSTQAAATGARASEEDIRGVEAVLSLIFERSGLDVESRTTTVGDGVRAELTGPDRKLLLAKDAELLWAIQFLLNRMARRAWPTVSGIQLDCEGFRHERDHELVELVREVAQQVQRTGTPKMLEPMNPYERRVVHITVREFDGLSSRSDGEGFLKTVTIERTGG